MVYDTKILLLMVLLFMPSSLLGEELYIAAMTSREIIIYDLDGNRIARYEPSVGRITRSQYENGRAMRDTLEYRSLPSLPWFFAPSGSFYTFMPSGTLRYYKDVRNFIDYDVSFSSTSLLQVINDDAILIRNANNNLAIWYRSLNQEQNLSIPLHDIAGALYISNSTTSDYIALAKEERLDYYTNPVMGSVASQFNNTISLLSRDTKKSIQADWIGSDIHFDSILQRLYFFQDKVLHYLSLDTQKMQKTKLSFEYILTTVAGSWQVPSILHLGNNRHLIWHRIPFERSQQAQLSLYDAQTGNEVATWQAMGEQGTLTLIREVV